MKTTHKSIVLSIAISLTFISCRTVRPKTEIETLTRKNVTINERDVDITIPEDSSVAVFSVKINPETKKPELNKLGSMSNKRAGAPQAVIDTNGVLRIKCPCLEYKTTASVSDTSTVTETTTKKSTVKYINEPSRWQWFQIYSGRFLYILIVLIAAFRFIRSRLGL